ncbi:hypothetical protein D3C72_1844160 [compost metagenome]
MVTLNAPVISACDAITVAMVASTTTGSRAHCGASMKNGFFTASAFSSTSAPWPK